MPLVRLGTGLSIVIAHASITTGNAHLQYANILAKKFTCYVMDRRVCGRSEDAADFTIEREFEVIQALFKVAGTGTHFFGHYRGENMDEKFTAFCGLCCADCIPSNLGFFYLVNNLEEMLSGLQFDEYARLKAERNSVFEDYPTFVKVLKGIKSLKCSGHCREGGGKPDCEIRKCAQGKGYPGCWECRDRQICTKLYSLRLVHSNLDYHLDLIGKYGPKNWFSKRKAHYRWQREDSE